MNVDAPPTKPRIAAIEDVQANADTRQIPINKVGIKDIYHPVKVKDRANGEQHTVANFNMYVNLPAQLQGHAHVEVRGDPASPRARDIRGLVRQDARGDDRASACGRRAISR